MQNTKSQNGRSAFKKALSYAAVAGLMMQLAMFGFFGLPGASAQAGTGSLTVTKVVNGGTAAAADFDLFVNGLPVESGVATTTLAAGTYVVTEASVAGYTVSFSGDCSAEGIVTLGVGGTANCTLTNTFTGDPAATSTSLTITKVVSGGSLGAANFPLFVNGVPITSGVATTTLAAGTYTVTETNQPGYVASFSGNCNASGQVTLASGATANCTITNVFNPAAGTVIPGQTFTPVAAPVVTPLGAQAVVPGLPTTGGDPNAAGNTLSNTALIALAGLLAATGAGLVLVPSYRMPSASSKGKKGE